MSKLRRAALIACVTVAASGFAMAAFCSSALAGRWTLVSCTEPNGRPAPTDGWSTGVYAGKPIGGDADTCASGGSLTAVSGAYVFSQPNGSGPDWVFTAPPQSTILGGTLTARLRAPDGVSWLGTPGSSFDNADVITSCVYSAPCGKTGEAGVYRITHAGGTRLYAPALCLNFSQSACPAQGSASAINAEVDIHAAEIELSNGAEPGASGFSGPLLSRGARGVADLLFTAADPNGPGVYQVSVFVDHRLVYNGTPDTNGGWCVPVGTDPSNRALMFDHLQPCRAIETVDIPVNTRALSNGSHDLQVVVADAAGNAATVLDRSISTSNPATTPLPRRPGEVHARLRIFWRWKGGRTWLLSIRARNLPRDAHITVACIGRGCPRLRLSSAGAADASSVWRALEGRRFRTGDRLLITITAPHKLAERIELSIRDGAIPAARLL